MQTICTKHIIARSGIFLKENKILKINGTMLEKSQLEQHLEKIASSHNTTTKSQKDTYPVPHLIENFKTIEQVYQWMEQNKLHLCHWFTVDDLNHLKRGGRISPAVAFVGSLLGMKPILHVDDTGHLVNVGKIKGRRASLSQLVEKLEQTAVHIAEQTIFISHGDCPEDAELLANMIRKQLPVKDIIINPIGPVIGSHSGPGTLAVFFFGTKR